MRAVVEHAAAAVALHARTRKVSARLPAPLPPSSSPGPHLQRPRRRLGLARHPGGAKDGAAAPAGEGRHRGGAAAHGADAGGQGGGGTAHAEDAGRAARREGLRAGGRCAGGGAISCPYRAFPHRRRRVVAQRVLAAGEVPALDVALQGGGGGERAVASAHGATVAVRPDDAPRGEERRRRLLLLQLDLELLAARPRELRRSCEWRVGSGGVKCPHGATRAARASSIDHPPCRLSTCLAIVGTCVCAKYCPGRPSFSK